MTAATDYDYIIVGAGASGSVLANRLSVTPGARVLMLEAGPVDLDPRIPNPDCWTQLQGSELDWAYRTEPQAELGERVIDHPRGRVLGGSTAINAMVWLRGDAADFDGWGLGPEWSSQALWPLYELVESIDDTGTGLGLVPRNMHPWSQTLVAAAGELGHPANPDFNRTGLTGAGYYAVTRDGDGRRSAVNAYLAPARGRASLTLLTEARVRRLLIEDETVIGVEYTLRDGTAQIARSSGEVLLAAGVIGSPHLLFCSGVGAADELRRHGLPVHVDLPGVGANLQDHIAVSVGFAAAKPNPAPSRSGLGDAGLFVGATETSRAPLHLWLGPSTDQPGRTFSLGVGITHPASRGRLRWSDAGEPVLAPDYLAAAGDLETLVDGLALIQQVAETAALRGLWTGPAPEVFLASRDTLAKYIRATVGTQFHPIGTCRMGVDDLAVVDPRLRVRGLANVRVVDASVLPEITTGGPQAPTYVLAERAAELIRA